MSALGYGSPSPPPLLCSLLFFNTQLFRNSQCIQTYLQNDLPAVFRRLPPGRVFALHSTAVGSGEEEEVEVVIIWMSSWWSGSRRAGKQQVLPIGCLGVLSQKGLTKIAYSRSGDPTGNPSLCMGWRQCLVNPLAHELTMSLFTSMSHLPQVSARSFLHLPLCFPAVSHKVAANTFFYDISGHAMLSIF